MPSYNDAFLFFLLISKVIGKQKKLLTRIIKYSITILKGQESNLTTQLLVIFLRVIEANFVTKFYNIDCKLELDNFLLLVI